MIQNIYKTRPKHLTTSFLVLFLKSKLFNMKIDNFTKPIVQHDMYYIYYALFKQIPILVH